jgi:hypothetical protein
MDSIKTFASQCLGLGPSFSVLRDVFGFSHGTQRTMSLRAQMRRSRATSIGINAIMVCPESLSAADFAEVEYAIQGMREIYATEGIGVRAVEWYHVPTADADLHCVLGDDASSLSEAIDLTNDWTVSNDSLDVFFVQNITGGTIGWSAVNGPCSKDASSGMSGSVVGLEGSPDLSIVVLAHEVGHYLGLPHVTGTNNVMRESISSSDTDITTSQGNTMKQKTCFVGDEC